MNDHSAVAIHLPLAAMICTPHAVHPKDGRFIRTALLHYLGKGEAVNLNFTGIEKMSREFLLEISPVICSLLGHRFIRCEGLSEEQVEQLRLLGKDPLFREEMNKIPRDDTPSEDLEQKLEASVTRLVKNHQLAMEDLTDRQVADVIKQALQSGDLRRLVDVDTCTQKVTYTPGQGMAELQEQVAQLSAQLLKARLYQVALTRTSEQLTKWDEDLRKGETTSTEITDQLEEVAPQLAEFLATPLMKCGKLLAF